MNAPTDRLRELIAERRPGYSLPQPFYTDDTVLAAELDRIWRRYWLFAGPSVAIPNPGDYFLYALGHDSIIVIRGDDGQIRALHNTCRHRGSVVCTAPSGHAKKLVCPYHQWVYDTDGRLLTARLMPDDFDKTAFGLAPVATHVYEGLVFLCLADDPPDFGVAARDYEPYVKPYRLGDTKVCFSKQYNLNTNWKLITENFRECYHCAGGHPQYCRVVLGTSGVEPKDEVQRAWDAAVARWQQLGLATGGINFTPDTWHHVVRYPLKPGALSESLDGQPVAPVLGDLPVRDAGAMAVVQYPNFWLEASSDYTWLMRTTPVTATRTLVDAWWLVRADAVEGKDYDVERVTGLWQATAGQDWTLCENNQAGINSSAYRPGPYGPDEQSIENFLLWYLNQLEAKSCRLKENA